MSAQGNQPTVEFRDGSRTLNYVVSIVVNAIVLYIDNHLLAWGVPFITPAFGDVLWAIDLSIWATIIANALFLAYDAQWFRELAQIVLSGIALGVTAILYARFPFDFGSATLNDLASVGLLLVMFALIVAIIVQAVIFFADLARQAV